MSVAIVVIGFCLLAYGIRWLNNKSGPHPRRGIIVEWQVAEVINKRRSGLLTEEQALEQVLILKYGENSQTHLDHVRHMDAMAKRRES